MFIEKDGVRLHVPDNFFERKYRFPVTRTKAIIAKSGLPPTDFAFRYSFVWRIVDAWVHADRTKRKFPTEDERLRLVFIEYALDHR